MIAKERVLDFYEAAYLQYYQKSSGWDLIYIDEFHISLSSTLLYNWSKKCTPAILAVDPDQWRISCVVAFSGLRVEELLASNISINAKSFAWFIGDVWALLNRERDEALNCWIIFDNSSVHTSKFSTEFARENKIRWISIPPYSP